MTNKKLIEDIAAALDAGQDKGIDRAFAAVEKMHDTSLARVETMAIEAMARFERVAADQRTWAQGVLQQVVNMRLSIENPGAFHRLFATLGSAAGGGNPGASPVTKASTDAGRTSAGSINDEDVAVPLTADQLQERIADRERVLASTGDEFAGVAIPRK